MHLPRRRSSKNITLSGYTLIVMVVKMSVLCKFKKDAVLKFFVVVNNLCVRLGPVIGMVIVPRNLWGVIINRRIRFNPKP
jgi:hypothetical protein